MGGKKIPFENADKTLFGKFGKEIGLSNKTIEQSLVFLKHHVRKAASIIRPPDAENPDDFYTLFAEIVRNSCLRILGE